MSSDQSKTNHLVHSEHSKPSDPHLGHDGTNFEGIDASVRMVVISLAIIALTLVVTFAITIPIHRLLREDHPLGSLPSPLAPARIIPPLPVLQVHPWEYLPELRAHENQVLFSSGVDKNGHAHVPITSAMDAVISKVDVRAGSPQGLTTPGGQSREFSHGLSAMPAQYQTQTPVIAGEIQKNAPQ